MQKQILPRGKPPTYGSDVFSRLHPEATDQIEFVDGRIRRALCMDMPKGLLGKDELNLFHGKDVLVVAPNNGMVFFVESLAQLGAKATYIYSYSYETMDGIEAYRKDLEGDAPLDFLGGKKFDYFFCIDQEGTKKLQPALLREAAEILKEGGLAIIGFFSWEKKSGLMEPVNCTYHELMDAVEKRKPVC